MTFSSHTKDILFSEINRMDLERDNFSKRPGLDFSRNRKLGFKDLIRFQISMQSGSVNHELMKYFCYHKDTPTLSAFYQQRRKLSDDVFQTLFYRFNSHYPPICYKNKFLLLACDGSSFSFTRNPKDLDSYYDPNGRSVNGFNQIHLVALFNLLSQRYLDAQIQPIRKKNEFLALSNLIDRFDPPPGTSPIFIADRGFHSYNVFAHAIEKDAYFLIRAKDINTKRLLGNDFPDTDSFDVTVNRILTRTQSKKKHRHPLLEDQYRYICKAVTFSYLPDDSDAEYPISLRVLRFPIGEDSFENVITNLPEKEFPAMEIKSLYGMRWGIETSFCTLKHALGAINLHSKKREMITHELWARLILFNFCSIITAHTVSTCQKKKHVHQVNYTVAFQACHYFIRLHNGESPPDIEDLIRQHTLPVRPGRNYAHQHRFQIPVSFTYRF